MKERKRALPNGSALLAESQGFEPWVEFPLRRFSKPVPSATRPRLHRDCCFGGEKLNPDGAGCKPALRPAASGRTLPVVSDVPQPGDRLRAAMLEIGLAVGGLLLGTIILTILSALGLLPTEGSLGRGVQMAGGPAITLLAVLGYRAVAQWIDRNESPMLGAGVKPGALFPRSSVGVAVGVAALGIGAAIGGSYVLGLGLELIGAPVAEQDNILKLVEGFKSGDDVLPLILLAVSAVALAPMTEELLFRGLVFRRIAARGHAWPEAYALSAAVFAAIHTNPAGFVIYAWLGLVFAESYRRSGRLWVAMLVHAGNNAFALSLLVWG